MATLHNLLRFVGLRSAQSVWNVVNNKFLFRHMLVQEISAHRLLWHYATCTMLKSTKERKKIRNSNSTKHVRHRYLWESDLINLQMHKTSCNVLTPRGQYRTGDTLYKTDAVYFVSVSPVLYCLKKTPWGQNVAKVWSFVHLKIDQIILARICTHNITTQSLAQKKDCSRSRLPVLNTCYTSILGHSL